MHVHVMTFVQKAHKQDFIHLSMFIVLIYKAECNICIAQLTQNYLTLNTVSYSFNIGAKICIIKQVYYFFFFQFILSQQSTKKD